MIDHTGLSVTDPAASRRFYELALAPLGYRVLMEVPKEHTGGVMVLGMGVAPKPDFWLHEGPPLARVDSVDCVERLGDGELHLLRGFTTS